MSRNTAASLEVKAFVKLLMDANTTGATTHPAKGTAWRDGPGAGAAAAAGNPARVNITLDVLRAKAKTLSPEATRTLAAITGAPDPDHFVSAIQYLTISGLQELQNEMATMGLD